MIWVYRIFVCVMLVLIYFKLDCLDRIDENLQLVRAFETEDRQNKDTLDSLRDTIEALYNDIDLIKDKLKIR
ncbi:hypothetical protein [Campylobacter hyointestinalis]|uniref:Uncharacterized protein n=1 Tax=Campylobacter hyointestinalis subsp. hyointestinalis TaxID=91352 RepID=A0A9W5AP25_CAMHY|nr:hypothetical protein [Campylobacter hyointestinalis]CUU73968.1 Uncharacterised protein [Campylobacter hyointestinalis subsp. hyointestinalis]CUU81801.1 Uncharacterised protein [Campylobacter hyointestinalis subsp. hyointestinalis]